MEGGFITHMSEMAVAYDGGPYTCRQLTDFGSIWTQYRPIKMKFSAPLEVGWEVESS